MLHYFCSGCRCLHRPRKFIPTLFYIVEHVNFNFLKRAEPFKYRYDRLDTSWFVYIWKHVKWNILHIFTFGTLFVFWYHTYLLFSQVHFEYQTCTCNRQSISTFTIDTEDVNTFSSTVWIQWGHFSITICRLHYALLD